MGYFRAGVNDGPEIDNEVVHGKDLANFPPSKTPLILSGL